MKSFDTELAEMLEENSSGQHSIASTEQAGISTKARRFKEDSTDFAGRLEEWLVAISEETPAFDRTDRNVRRKFFDNIGKTFVERYDLQGILAPEDITALVLHEKAPSKELAYYLSAVLPPEITSYHRMKFLGERAYSNAIDHDTPIIRLSDEQVETLQLRGLSKIDQQRTINYWPQLQERLGDLMAEKIKHMKNEYSSTSMAQLFGPEHYLPIIALQLGMSADELTGKTPTKNPDQIKERSQWLANILEVAPGEFEEICDLAAKTWTPKKSISTPQEILGAKTRFIRMTKGRTLHDLNKVEGLQAAGFESGVGSAKQLIRLWQEYDAGPRIREVLMGGVDAAKLYEEVDRWQLRTRHALWNNWDETQRDALVKQATDYLFDHAPAQFALGCLLRICRHMDQKTEADYAEYSSNTDLSYLERCFVTVKQSRSSETVVRMMKAHRFSTENAENLFSKFEKTQLFSPTETLLMRAEYSVRDEPDPAKRDQQVLECLFAQKDKRVALGSAMRYLRQLSGFDTTDFGPVGLTTTQVWKFENSSTQTQQTFSKLIRYMDPPKPLVEQLFAYLQQYELYDAQDMMLLRAEYAAQHKKTPDAQKIMVLNHLFEHASDKKLALGTSILYLQYCLQDQTGKVEAEFFKDAGVGKERSIEFVKARRQNRDTYDALRTALKLSPKVEETLNVLVEQHEEKIAFGRTRRPTVNLLGEARETVPKENDPLQYKINIIEYLFEHETNRKLALGTAMRFLREESGLKTSQMAQLTASVVSNFEAGFRQPPHIYKILSGVLKTEPEILMRLDAFIQDHNLLSGTPENQVTGPGKKSVKPHIPPEIFGNKPGRP